jgi:7,8-dihydropterin-6-yl-methyl-4-(beta-D-ribofuranosyl)aminobenzene 5'-phosphate synthase
MLKLTILCENTVVPSADIIGEHGFAVLIETESKTYLFDTGQGHSIVHNALCLGKDLRKVKRIFLSHGHYDHTGGLKKVLNITEKIDIYAHPDIFSKRIAVLKRGGEKINKNVGMPESKEAYEALGAHFVFNKTFTDVAPDMYLTGEVPRLATFEKADKRLMIKKDGRLVPDPLNDDQSLVLQTPQGLVVILGCAHSGMINTLNHIKEKLPGQKIRMVIGGTHIGFLKDEQVRETIVALDDFSIEQIGVSHCTGLAQSMKLMQAFGERFFFANAGSVVEV